MSHSKLYPKALNVHSSNQTTVDFVRSNHRIISVAEVGAYRGHTTSKLVDILSARRGSELHIFDFDDVAAPLAESLAGRPCRVTAHSNSRMLLDSYNWSLMKLLERSSGPIFDYVFLDGAHTWQHDGLAFFLLDRLLRPGGFFDFDDYWWTMAGSKAVGPWARDLYPHEQMVTPHIKHVVELLAKPAGYQEVVAKRIYQKPTQASLG